MIVWIAVWALTVGPVDASVMGPTPPGDAGPFVTQADAAPLPDRWIAEDKARHFAMSFAATGLSYGTVRLAVEPAPARAAAVGAAVAMGIGKELWDVARGGPFSVKDLVWDALGVALGYTLAQRMD